MPKNVRTARGDVVDFDTLRIKQSLAQAPMNIEVERRKKFIDTKEGTARQRRTNVIAEPGAINRNIFVTNEEIRTSTPGPDSVKPEVKPADFEIEGTPAPKVAIEPVPVIPERDKK